MICMKDTLKEGQEHQSSGCRVLFILQKESILKRYLRYVKLVRYSLLRSVPFLGREKNRICGNYGILGKFVQIGIWCILIISSSNRINKLRVCLSSTSTQVQNANFTWKPKDCEFFQRKKTFYGCTRVQW